MLRNHIKIGIRNLKRQGSYTLINVLGLSVSLAFVLLMGLWIHHEMSFDRFHESGENIYQIALNEYNENGNVRTFVSTSYPLATAIAEEIPEVNEVANFGTSRPRLINFESQQYQEKGLDADASFFELFAFPLIQGSTRSIFIQSDAIVISKRLAAKVFGSNWEDTAIGKTIILDNDSEYIVTGVFEDVPETSSLQFDFVYNRANTIRDQPDQLRWDMLYSNTYVKLQQGVDVKSVSEKITQIQQDRGNWKWGDIQIYLYPIHKQHLYSSFENGKPVASRMKNVRIFTGAALFLLLISCINFINLSTARSSLRAKEVGVRKVVGAGKRTLVQQFIVESALVTIISVTLAVLIAEILSPYASNLMDKTLTLNFGNPQLIGSLLLGTIAVILLAGAYPAFALSSFKINNVLRGKLALNTSSAGFRKGLVVFQFVLSAILIISALFVQRQVHFMKNKKIGLNREQIVLQPTHSGLDKNFDLYKNELENLPGIAGVTISNNNPLTNYSSTFGISWPGKDPDENISFGQIQTDEGFINLLDLELLEGRNFSKDLKSDSTNIIINKKAASIMGFKDSPVGKTVNWGKYAIKIIGLLKDFHYRPLHYDIEPLVLVASGNYTPRYLIVKTEEANIESTIKKWDELHTKFSSDYPFQYTFLDNSFNTLYKNETRTGTLANYFAWIAIFISCLGLLGLSTFAAERRIKEIGIRKVLGASVSNIVLLLSKDFLILIVIALGIASPVAYYFMGNWLEDFAFHINLEWWVFALAGGLLIGVAFLTMSWQSIRAALSNPAKTLKTE